ncbi:hypothetical protein B879_02786 [Cecembia lonarensis LW9]|uniref:Uncharacterized protein n=1 Tax=Cecembia lonarensis (strain CCUG 58316 / KCTC 22772 / LW9) TaxID=1225176 RepID=K1LE27_CECL9|nr:hypothetical protein B879_02786 [Cecembia lonarensis LW9]
MNFEHFEQSRFRVQGSWVQKPQRLVPPAPAAFPMLGTGCVLCGLNTF